MAGQGPAPAENRQRRNTPARGEWIYLPPLANSVLPALPKRAKGTGPWSARTRGAWAAWRTDPVTAEYGPADIHAAIDLAFLYEEWVRTGDRAAAAEIRQRQDRLGLNPKGKRDLRWRVGSAPSSEDETPPSGPRKRSSSKRRARLSVVK